MSCGWKREISGSASVLLVAIAFALAMGNSAFAGFTDIGAGLVGVQYSSVAWGDYDNDGDLDVAIAGYTGTAYTSRIYRNDAGAFNNIGASLTGVRDGALTWGDYDRDGDLDLALCGYYNDGSPHYVGNIYRNDAGTFVNTGAGLSGSRYGSLAWGDYDNDGDLDLALCGFYYDTANHYVGAIYRNNGGTFTDVGAGLTGVYFSRLAWSDYDNDGDLDLCMTGYDGTAAVGKVYRNDGGAFTGVSAGVPGALDGSLAWGDYDNDGDLDLAVTGFNSGYIGKICRNAGGTLVDAGVVVPKVRYSSVAWGDYDNDGDLDLAIAGYDGAARITRIYRNNAGLFADIAAGLPGVRECSLAWGDYDNDGDLDLAVSGYTGTTRISNIYRNDGVPPNTPPTAPTNLSVNFADNDITFLWGEATDAETLSGGLSYNLRVGTTPGNDDVFRGTASLTSGLRGLPAIGNAQENLFWTIGNLSPQSTYYWSVQAIDTAFAGSAWATEQSTDHYNITGYIREDTGAGVPAVLLTATGSSTATTDSSGYYCLSVPVGWSGTVTPSKAACDFNPASRSYANVTNNLSGQDFLATKWFSGIDAGIVGATSCSLAWGDYDNDGDLDLAIAGMSGIGYVSKIYRNDGGAFTDIGANLVAVSYCSLAWGDYDNDGDLDLALAGFAQSGGSASKIYRNDGGAFTDIGAGLTGVGFCAVGWGDYDNDGDLDLALAGSASGGRVGKLYRNNGGTFAEVPPAFATVYLCTLAWGDYDNDRDLDLAFSGCGVDPCCDASIYRNNGGWLYVNRAGLWGTCRSALAWGDYDNDGDLDLAVPGQGGDDVGHTRIYRNDGGALTDSLIDIVGVLDCSVAWGDYDNDGDLDLAIAGESVVGCESRIYRNDNGVFTDIGADLIGVTRCSLAWGDYDNDGDLDLVISGSDDVGYFSTTIYRNNGGVFNTPPSTPSGLSSSVDGNNVTFSWNAGADAETPTAGLSYNLRVGTSPGASDIFSGVASLSTGTRRLPATGNAQKNLSWILKNRPEGNLYWSAQAIDTAFAGSAWAPERVDADVRISGSVRTPVGAAIAGASVNAAGGAPVLTDSDGHYELRLSSGWNGTVTATKFGYKFDPPSRTYTNQTLDVVNQDYSATPTHISTAKRERNGTPVDVSAVVTAVFGNTFYLEATDRSNGIRAEKPGHGLIVGMTAEVTGILRTNADFEKYIEVATVNPTGTGVIVPALLNNRSLGGGDFEYDPLTGTGQRGVENGIGLNNIGLLIKTSGRVTAAGDGFFYIDDGTHARDASIFNGVRVLCDGLQMPEPGRYATITGISSIMKIGGRVFRCVRAREQADIVSL
ncbi:MAG: FG-GAP-like repeat-containing protein [Armatimonadota bacterium]|nr:FG-GAP-like repeat-containing protein [Armatimonadota bacterium]